MGFKKFVRTFGAVICLMLTIQGCDNTLDVNADWKEIAVVYGLLNPTDEVNYIRINKAYLSPGGDAFELAKESDSLYFDSLDVKVVEFQNGIERRVFTLEKVNGNDVGLPKDSGLFANDVNYLFRLTAQLKESDLSNTYSYKLQIVNKYSGSIITSNFDMIGRMDLLSPLKPFNPVLDVPSDAGRSLVFKYREGRFAKMYDAMMRFYYDEIDLADTTKVRHDSVDWTLFTGKETVSLRGYDESFVVVSSALFYENLLSKIAVNPNVKRKGVSFSIYFYGGGEQLYTYIQVNKPSLGIVQKKPEYSNISPGLGVFSSRYINRIEKIRVDDNTTKYLVESEKMKPLSFSY